jgi:acetate kinase
MKILALNCGSSSIKYKIFDVDSNYQLLAKGAAERIGQKSSSIWHVIENKHKHRIETSLPDHRTALRELHQAFVENKSSLRRDIGRIDGVGHRIVHGGERFRNPALINEDVINQIKKVARFAPLHCQPNITGIEVSRELLPDIPHVAVFDTAVHQTIESKAFLYGLPIEYYEKHKIRKYGFHGINHDYVANEAARILAKPIHNLKVITCHLGSGCSITAFEQGKSIDTSMGLTPLEGLVMGSRCGDLDPSVVLYLIDVLGLQVAQVSDLLNKKSGLLGLCGKNDMRDIIAMAETGDKRAQVAIEVFVYRVQKYIGAYVAALNGVDAIVFTGGIGENDPYIRARIIDNFSYLGAHADPEKNKNNETIFSSENSNIRLMNIPANEEIVIAQQAYNILKKNTKNIAQNTSIGSL